MLRTIYSTFVKKIAIIGQGYVGLPLAICAVKVGHHVVGFDLDIAKIEALKKGISHLEDILDDEIEGALASGNYFPSSNQADLKQIDIFVIAVPTSLDEKGNSNLSHLISASKIVGQVASKSALVINESTSFPGTLREIIMPEVIKANSGACDFEFAISPERVNPGNGKWGIQNTPRLVGGITNSAAEAAAEFYRSFCEEVVSVESAEIAESAKILENTFRLVNIAFINEFSDALRSLRIDPIKVIKAAATKPYGFLPFTPSIGIGGHCIPIDPVYMQEKLANSGRELAMVEIGLSLNKARPTKIAEQIREVISPTSGALLVYGLSYKPDVSDIRESPSINLIRALREQGFTVEWFDPHVNEWNGEFRREDTHARFEAILIAVSHAELSKDIEKFEAKRIFDLRYGGVIENQI